MHAAVDILPKFTELNVFLQNFLDDIKKEWWRETTQVDDLNCADELK